MALSLAAGCSSSTDDPANGKGAERSSADTFDYANQSVRLDSDLVIPSGKTVRVGPGVTFTAAAGVKIQVEGSLVVAATADAPTQFLGDAGDASAPSSWQGIEVESGGSLDLAHVDIEGAQYGIHAMKGATYKVDHAVFGTSFKPAVLEADGSFDHSIFNATTPPTIAVTVAVTIDDPNGTMTIIDASPTVTNSVFNGSSAFTDMVRVGGASVPVFDHDQFTGAHCAFHNFGATNNSPRVTNSIIENMAFGTMAFSSKPVFESCNFINNTDDVGYCYGAKTDNVPTLTGNYFQSGKLAVDASCAQIGTTDSGTVTAPVEGAGPSGL